MNFIQKYIFEIEISDSDEITIAIGTIEVTLKDGSKHLLPNVNICAIDIPKKRKIFAKETSKTKGRSCRK